MTPIKGKKKSKSKPKPKRNNVLCEQCGTYFSKPSNLNSHIEKVHKGLRWRCHICNEDQVSKHSHIRHYESKHKGEVPMNVDVNQRYATVFIDMPEKAKDAIIKDLSEQVKVQKVLLKSFRKRLMTTLKENIHLKGKLTIDSEPEQLEYRNLLGGGTDIENFNSNQNSDELENVKTMSECSIENSDESKGESDDDDDKCYTSTHYPDHHPVSIHSFVDDPEAGGSGV